MKSIHLSKLGRRKFLLGASALGLSPLAEAYAFKLKDVQPKILIVGAGSAGISLANRLVKALPKADISILDRKETHFYWPGLTLVATGAWDKKKVLADNGYYLPKKINWIKEMVAEFDPDNKQVITDAGRKVSYDFMVIASGTEYNYRAIEGFDTDLIGHKGIGSVYHSPDAASKTWDAIKKFSYEGGDGLFTLPSTPIRCAGAPLKMAFLTLDRLKQNGGFEKANLKFQSAPQKLFGIDWFHNFIEKRFQEDGMPVEYGSDLTAIDADINIATFTDADGNQVKKPYDFIHIVPPMRAIRPVRQSQLAWQEGAFAGWLEVEQDTLQHKHYPEIFGCGDVNGTPRGKTAATVKMSVPIVVENLLAQIAGQDLTASFDGYTSCPLLTKFGAAMVIEFDYQGNLTPSFPFVDPYKESWFGWVMKEQLLQPTYIQMLRGRV